MARNFTVFSLVFLMLWIQGLIAETFHPPYDPPQTRDGTVPHPLALACYGEAPAGLQVERRFRAMGVQHSIPFKLDSCEADIAEDNPYVDDPLKIYETLGMICEPESQRVKGGRLHHTLHLKHADYEPVERTYPSEAISICRQHCICASLAERMVTQLTNSMHGRLEVLRALPLPQELIADILLRSGISPVPDALEALHRSPIPQHLRPDIINRVREHHPPEQTTKRIPRSNLAAVLLSSHIFATRFYSATAKPMAGSLEEVLGSHGLFDEVPDEVPRRRRPRQCEYNSKIGLGVGGRVCEWHNGPKLEDGP